jgi:hypothetical protein
MPLPWLQLIDAALGVANFARGRKAPVVSDEQQLEVGGRALGGLETRLAGVMVAALKEAFDRDSRRLELEREQLDAERQRAERALRLELQRQAGDREIGRLRLLAGVAVASWIGTLLLSARLIGAGAGARVLLGAGSALLLGAIAASFTGQARVAASLNGEAPTSASPSGIAGALALWLSILGLVLIGVAALIA